jgi:hypothetical protein
MAIELTDGHLLDVFHPVARDLSGLTVTEHQLKLFAHKGVVKHSIQAGVGVDAVYCFHCRSNRCPGCLYVLAKEVQS